MREKKQYMVKYKQRPRQNIYICQNWRQSGQPGVINMTIAIYKSDMMETSP